MLKTTTSVINASQIATPITFAGDVTLSTGNLVIGTSGKGIDFSATAGTGTSELLADYEEGTWTPVLIAGTSGTITLGSPTNSGRYTKIGRQVTVIVLASVGSVSSPVGTLSITGFPFANGAATRVPATVMIQAGAVTTTASKSFIIESASGAILFTRFAAGAYTSDASDIQAATDVYFEATYFV